MMMRPIHIDLFSTANSMVMLMVVAVFYSRGEGLENGHKDIVYCTFLPNFNAWAVGVGRLLVVGRQDK
jgi:hypothetical protein